MTLPNPANYSRTRDYERAKQRATAKRSGPEDAERVPAKPVIAIDPDPDWSKQAKTLWTAAMLDEASEWWSSGDVARLYVAVDYYDRMTRGARQVPSAQGLAVVMDALTELRLSDRAKRQDNIWIDRGDQSAGADDWFAQALDQIEQGQALGES